MLFHDFHTDAHSAQCSQKATAEKSDVRWSEVTDLVGMELGAQVSMAAVGWSGLLTCEFGKRKRA